MRGTDKRRSHRVHGSGRPPLPAKLLRPQARAIVRRPRLLKRLETPGGLRWSWIAAPAGAGKTMLASSWIEESHCADLWISLDAGDADPATFFHYVALAGKHRAAGRRVHLPPLTPEFLPGLEVYACRFFEQLFALYPQPFATVLDNCHEVAADSALMQSVLGALIESLPQHGCLVCLSRGNMPAALVRWSTDPGFLRLGWDDLSFTDEEARAFAETRSPRAAAAVVECNRWLRGWVAGLTLLLRAPEELASLAPPRNFPRPELFDYLAEEVLGRSTPQRRDFLLRCAVLTDIEVEPAAALGDRPDAGEVLAQLYAERLFIERRNLASGPSYRFHPLFRDFLRARLDQRLGRRQVGLLKARAAALLEARGDLEAATIVALQCDDAGLLARLILLQAESLFAQGRILTLGQWIEAVPEPVRSENGWLLYWLGVSLSLRQPPRGRTILEQAYQRLQETGETLGAWLAAAGIIYSHFIVWGTEPERLAHWVGIFQTLQAQNGGSVPQSIELQVISLLGHFASHCPEHPVVRRLMERAGTLAVRLSDPAQRCTIGSIAVGFLIWQGDESAAAALVEDLQRGRDEAAPATLGSLVFDIWGGILLWAQGSHELSFERLASARARCCRSGLRIYEWHCIVHMAMAALGMDDIPRAGQLIEESFHALTPQHVNVAYMTRALQAQYLALSGSVTAAATLARALRADIGILGEAPSTAAFVECLLGSALLEAGALDEAAECARSALAHAGRLPSDRFSFDAGMLLAGVELERGESEAMLSWLRSALAIAAKRDFTSGMSLFQRRRAGRLIAVALRDGIEAEQARRLIGPCRLPVPDDPRVAALWPARLRIATLGAFAVEVDGQPIERSRQVAARKPLEVLKVLVGEGPAEIGLEALQAALWPQLEGDAARNAAHVAIHRLRRLLVHEDAIQVERAAIRLEMTFAWVDVDAFRRLGARIQTALTAGVRSRPQCEQLSRELVCAYPGHFLPSEDQPWAVSARERHRSRFVHLAAGLSSALERLGAAEEAVALNRHGIDLDPHSETFHCGVIRGLLALEQPAEALEAYRRCRELLRTGLGVEPSPALERLVRQPRGVRSS